MLDTERRKQARSKKVNIKEKESDRVRKRTKRENSMYRTQEQENNTQRKREKRNASQQVGKTLEDAINDFHKEVEQGPVYECCVYNQLWYRHSVILARIEKFPDCAAVHLCIPQNQRKKWLCNTCSSHMKKSKIPPCAAANAMGFPNIPDKLKDLHHLEWRLVSPRIPFMKIFAAPRGGQKKIRGNVVNVPCDTVSTFQVLPHLPNEHQTIQVKLKRHLKYINHVLSQNVRPSKVREAAEYLVKNGKLFQEQGISFDEAWEADEERVEPEVRDVVSDRTGMKNCSEIVINEENQLNELLPGCSNWDAPYKQNVNHNISQTNNSSTTDKIGTHSSHPQPGCSHWDAPCNNSRNEDMNLFNYTESPNSQLPFNIINDSAETIIVDAETLASNDFHEYKENVNHDISQSSNSSTTDKIGTPSSHPQPGCSHWDAPCNNSPNEDMNLLNSTESPNSQLPLSVVNDSTETIIVDAEILASNDFYDGEQFNGKSTAGEEKKADEEWSENEDENEITGGNLDTMLTSPDFIEDEERNLEYTLAPGQGRTPVSIFKDKYSEELSYPNIYCGQSRPENKGRKVPVYYSEICKSEIRHVDRRVAQDPDNLFFKTKKVQMKTMLDKVQIAMRKCKSKDLHLTAGSLKNPDTINQIIFKDIGYKFLNTVRGSPPYFQSVAKDLFAMIRQLGPATFFASFSAAETRWKHLLKILGKVVDKVDYTDIEVNEMSWPEKCRLIQSDPATCARHFDRQVQLLFKFLKSEVEPLGKLEDYFYRVEFQQRGSPHIHCLLWIKDSPQLEGNTEDAILFIDRYISTEKPCEEIDDEMSKLVANQMHRHSHTCRKGRKFQCRFGFPKPPMPSTCVLEPIMEAEEQAREQYKKNYKIIQEHLKEMAMGKEMNFQEFLVEVGMTYDDYISAIRSSLNNTTIFLKRNPNAIRVNQYNPILLKAWRANIDIQFVTNVYACAMYIASYVTKSQRGMSELLRKTADEARENDRNDIRQQLRTVGNKFLNAVEISAQEACYILLQLSMRRSSRQVIFVNTSPPQDRVFLLKPQCILEQMDDTDDNVEARSLIKRYEERPQDLENVSLADFACWYTENKSPLSQKLRKSVRRSEDGCLPETGSSDQMNEDDDNECQRNESLSSNESQEIHQNGSKQQYTKRQVPKILRTCRFNKEKETEKHYREILMLYTNWRDETTDLLGTATNYEERYKEIKEMVEQNRSQYELHAEELDEAVNNLQEADDLQDAWDQVAPHAQNEEAIDDNLQIDNEQGEAYDIGPDLGLPVQVPPEELRPNNMIPDEEYRAKMRTLNMKQSEFVMDVLHHAKTSDEPIYRFLSGGAGVGKTHVTLALYQSLYRYLNSKPGVDPDKACIVLLAPTGKAAYLIRGNTIHSALKLPANQSLNTYKPLHSDILNTLRMQMINLKYIFIDEVSMVGFNMINFVHKRLQEIMGSAKTFGGLSVIFVGDLFQLQPVCDKYIFENGSSGYSPLASNLWEQNVKMFELTTIMRQDNGGQFAELPNRLREGNQTNADNETLASRIIKHGTPEHERIKDSLHLYIQNKPANAHNMEKFLRANTEKYEITAIDSVVESVSADLRHRLLARIPTDPRKTMQLPTELQIAVDLKYEVVLNTDTSDGLTNGASCIVKFVQVPQNKKARGIIWVQFEDENIGKKRRSEYKNKYNEQIDKSWTPIFPETRKFSIGKNHEVNRTQFPLRSAAAKTIHRSQGDTVSEIVLDLTGRSQPGLHYVAMSRVREFQNLHLLNFDAKKAVTSQKVKQEMNRLRQEHYLLTQNNLYQIDADIKIAYINAQSLHRHKLDIAHDFNLRSADIFVCAETRFQENDTAEDTEIAGFSCFRNDEKKSGHRRPPHGLAAYFKKDFKEFCPTTSNMDHVEIIVSSVKTKSGTLKLFAIYKPPTTPVQTLIKALYTAVRQHLCQSEKMIIMGDFNIDFMKTNPQYDQLRAFMVNMNLKQLITKPTTDMRTAIDHIYTDISNVTCGVSETYYSFHKVVWIAVKWWRKEKRFQLIT